MYMYMQSYLRYEGMFVHEFHMEDVFAGRLYAVGGHDGYEHLGSGEMFDPVKNCWTPIAAMNTLRYVCMNIGILYEIRAALYM